MKTESVNAGIVSTVKAPIVSKKMGSRVYFGTVQASDTEEKSKFGFKQATNIAGVIAWIGMVAYGAKKMKLFEPKSAERVLESTKALIKKTQGRLEDLDTAISKDEIASRLEGLSPMRKTLVKAFDKMGISIQKAKNSLGGELFNNLLYAFGTLVVMPVVILTSPFGKKQSTKEDKAFAVARQPLSVAATFGMQLTFDKLLGKYLPQAVRENKFEDKAILGADGKVKPEYFDKIKYNTDDAKSIFQGLLKKDVAEGGLKGLLTEDEVKELFQTKTFETEDAKTLSKKFDAILTRKGISDIPNAAEKTLEMIKEGKSLKQIQAELKRIEVLSQSTNYLKEQFGTLKNVYARKEMAITKTKVVSNVVVASLIGCTFLNVVYGKMMKAIKGGNKESKQVSAKEVK